MTITLTFTLVVTTIAVIAGIVIEAVSLIRNERTTRRLLRANSEYIQKVLHAVEARGELDRQARSC